MKSIMSMSDSQCQKSVTYAQKCILEKVRIKQESMSFQDWPDYEESYGADYNDCHGDYYDTE